MAIGSDVVGGMMELFDKVMSVKGLSTLKGGGWKTLDPEDVAYLSSTPEAQQHHLTTDWMDKVLGKQFPKPAGPTPPPKTSLQDELKQYEEMAASLDKILGKTTPKSVAFKQLTQEPGVGWLQDIMEKSEKETLSPAQKASVAFKPGVKDPQITSTLNLPPGNAQNPILQRDPNLPMDEPSRMARAKAGGFTTPAFRGVSRPSRQSPEPSPSYGYYSAESKGKNPAELAELYAMEFHSGKHGTPSIMPLLLNTQDYLVYNAKEKMWSEVNSKAIEMARKQGKKGVVMQNVWDEPHGKGKTKQSATVYITIDPTTIRSKTGAAFDPKKYSINDLLASGRAFVVPPNLLRSVQSGTLGRQGEPGQEVPGVGFVPTQDPHWGPEEIAKGIAKDIYQGLFIPHAAETGEYQVKPKAKFVGGKLTQMVSEEDIERARMAKTQEAKGAEQTAALAMTGGLGGVERGAVGAFGGKLGSPFKPGAAQTAKTVLNPSKDLIRATSDDLFRLRNWVTADKTEVAQHLDTMPPEFKTAEMQEKFYRRLEDPKEPLSPGEEAVFNKYILPMRDEIQKLSQTAGKYGMPLEDNEWVHRVVKGQEPIPTGGEHAVPQLGTHTLPRKTSAMMPRSLYVLEHQGTGRRIVVSQSEPGIATVWQKGVDTKVKWGDDLKLGQPIMAGGQKFIVKHAKTSELEAETPFRYQKSAAVNLGDALVKMRSVVRNIEYLDRLTKSPDWLKWATRAGGNMKAPANWKAPAIPQLKDWLVHPKLRAPLDDFFQPGFHEDALESIRRINRWSVGTLFWTPIPHIENVAGHWYVGRGWEWLKPSGYYNLFNEGARAIKSVITMDKDYQDLLKHGSALISGGVRNADFYKVLGKKFGLEVERNPNFWTPIAKKLGYADPVWLARAWYQGVNRVLWQANDMFMMQRVFELERRGLSRLDAIKEAEKHIPNYRVPPEVLGSRLFSKAIQEPALTAFGRYHYGVWNSYTNMVRDMIGPKATPEERFQAVGNLMALGSLVFAVYPAVSWGLQKLTGDKDIKKLPRGPASIPSTLYQSLPGGEKQWYDVIGQSITLAPPFKEGLEQIAGPGGRDFFTGKHIEQPGEKNPWRRAAQRFGHAVGSMAAPVKQGLAAAHAVDEKGVPREILKNLVGTEDLTAKQRRGKRMGKKIERREARKERKKHPGFLGAFE